MLFRIFALFGLCALLAACNSVPPSSLSADARANFRLTEVKTHFSPDAKLNYTPAEDDLARAKGLSASDTDAIQALAHSPEGRAFIENRAGDRMRDALMRAVAPVFSGSAPMRADVTIKSIDIPGGFRSVTLGGAASLQASVALVDAKSGATLADYPMRFKVAPRGGGVLGSIAQAALESSGTVRDPYERLAESFAEDFANWLRQK